MKRDDVKYSSHSLVVEWGWIPLYYDANSLYYVKDFENTHNDKKYMIKLDASGITLYPFSVSKYLHELSSTEQPDLEEARISIDAISHLHSLQYWLYKIDTQEIWMIYKVAQDSIRKEDM